MSGSARPCITSAGQRMRCRCGERLPEASTALSWRAKPAGSWARSKLSPQMAALADRLQALVDQDKLKSIQRAVEDKLQSYRQAMEVDTYRKTFHTLFRDRLLESVGISELSILQ